MKFSSVAAGAALMLASAPAWADVKMGVGAWQRGDYKAAVTEWRPLAIKGDADAQFNLGQAYKLGRGVTADLKQAESWYRKAALQGHRQAEDNYGLVLFQNGSRKESVEWLERSSRRGEARSQYVLGTALFNGDFVEKDWVRAYALMTRASSAGLPQASQTLAQMDQYIPLADRQKGGAMAREIELASARPIESGPVVTELPPSRAGADDPAPGERPAPVKIAKTAPVKPAQVKAAPVKTAALAGGWRIQVGAFSDAARARALWASLERNVGGMKGLQPYLVKAGAVTRLQAGPLPSKAAAEQKCAAVKSAGQPCLTVRT